MKKEESEFKLTEVQENKLTLEELKFVFSESDKLLMEFNRNAEILTKRAAFIFSAVIASMMALLTFSFDRFSELSGLDGFVATAVLAVAYLGYTAYLIMPVLKGEKYHHVGATPESLLTEDMFSTFYDGEKGERERSLYLAMLYSHSKTIAHNRDLNETRWKRIDTSIAFIWVLPFLMIGIYYFSSFLF